MDCEEQSDDSDVATGVTFYGVASSLRWSTSKCYP